MLKHQYRKNYIILAVNDKSFSQYIQDHISGQTIRCTPEEVNAVQIFSKRLTDEYNYSRDQIQTRPQFRIKSSPSGKEKYPIDIAVFKNNKKTYDNLFIN